MRLSLSIARSAARQLEAGEVVGGILRPEALENEAFDGHRRVPGQPGDAQDGVGQRRESVRMCRGMLLFAGGTPAFFASPAYRIPAEGAFPKFLYTQHNSGRDRVF